MTDLDDSSFTRLADDTIGRLFEQLEDAVGDAADVEHQDGILTIDFEDGGRFVVNKHQPNRQIWLASPVSGAAHFAWDGKGWVSTRGGAALLDVLAADVSKLAGAAVTLD
ncbi:MAG TPA: iron donor protein CyaY [Rhodospirillales bacterium]|nr:iron donor protein CyaY [Rhodospirillales bacterium]